MNSIEHLLPSDRGYMEVSGDRFLRTFVNLWILISLVLLVVFIFFWDLDRPVSMITSLIIGVLARTAIHFGKMREARIIFVGLYTVIACILPALVSGVRTPIILIWPMLFVLAGWLFGRRTMLLVVLVAIGAVSLIWVAEDYWNYQWPIPHRSAAIWMATVNAIFVMTAIAVWQLIGNYADVLRHDQEMRRQLDAANTALADKLELRTEQLDQSASELSQVRSEFERAYPMAMMAEVIPSVTHDLNTPVGNTGMAASTLSDALAEFKKRMGSDGGLRRSDLEGFLMTVDEGVKIIQSANQRAGVLVATLKQMSIDQVTQQRRSFALDQLVREVLITMAPSIKMRQATVRQEIAAGLDMDSFPGPLAQVLANLVQNALVHGFDGRPSGTITLRAHRVDGEHLRLEIEDDGVGMTSQSISHIFAPFYTTKAGQGGSGIGLTFSKKLIEETLGGQIHVESTPDVGTLFILELPLAA